MALGGEAQSPVKELIQHLQKLELPIDIYDAVEQSSALQKTPQMLFGHNDRPAKIRKPNPLRGPTGSDFAVASFDVGFGFIQQPIAQVEKDFPSALAQFIRRNSVQIRGAGGSPEFAQESGSQFVAVSFNQSYQAKRDHFIPLSNLDVCCEIEDAKVGLGGHAF
jgi:hypothetical protein